MRVQRYIVYVCVFGYLIQAIVFFLPANNDHNFQLFFFREAFSSDFRASSSMALISAIRLTAGS